MTTSINTIEAKENFADLINQVTHSKERIILTRRGKEIAAIIPIEDLQQLMATQDKRDLQDATLSLKEARLTGTTSLEELKEETGSHQ